jgi:protein O-GlcNAc transferase
VGGGRLRVAYVSSDFYKHATAYLLAGVLEQHDRNAVEVVLISYGAPQQDAMRERLTQVADRWVDVQAKTDA